MGTRLKARTGSALHYGPGGIDRLYARIWGDSIHFGFYTRPDSDLEAAVVETKRRMADTVGLASGANVLEVASGWGATSRYLARAFGVNVTATNIEPAHLQKAQWLCRQAGLQRQISHHMADYHDLPFADNGFDVWWCQEGMVHAHSKSAAFAEAYRCLKPGGRIIFSEQTTRRQLCSSDEVRRLVHRHGSDDLYDTCDFRDVLGYAGFRKIRVFDWSRHMGRHFDNLVRRIERNHTLLVRDIPEQTVAFNLSLWRLGRDLTARRAIGWHCFQAVKE